MEDPLILVINPGSMTTKVSLYEGEKEVVTSELEHRQDELAQCDTLIAQLPLRRAMVLHFLEERGALGKLAAIAARGAPLKPLEGGTYRINDAMLHDLRNGRIASPHISMLAALIAADISKEWGIPAFITDPVSVDEFPPIARLSGLPEVPRRSLWHALNCRAIVRKYAEETGKAPGEVSVIVAHLGSGITVACFEKGRAIDTYNANEESSYSPERAGTVPALGLVDLCYSGKYTRDEMVRKLTRESGLKAHLGTNDALAIEERIRGGDEQARTVYEGLAYSVSKHIGSLAAVLSGKVDAVLLTGSLARSTMLTEWITRRVRFICPVYVYPGQNEMEALAVSVLDILKGRQTEKIYI